MDSSLDNLTQVSWDSQRQNVIDLIQQHNNNVKTLYCLNKYKDGVSLLDMENFPEDEEYYSYMNHHALHIPESLSKLFPDFVMQSFSKNASEASETNAYAYKFDRFGIPTENLKLLNNRSASGEILMLPGDLSSLRFLLNSEPAFSYLPKAPKAVSSFDWSIARDEYAVMNTLRHIEDIKARGHWSLRQIRRQPMPPRRKAHHDYLLEEAVWLSTDIHEERRWKIAIARFLAQHIVDFHRSPNKAAFQLHHPWNQQQSATFEDCPSSGTCQPIAKDDTTTSSSDVVVSASATTLTSPLALMTSVIPAGPPTISVDTDLSSESRSSPPKSHLLFDDQAFCYSADNAYPLPSVLLNPELLCYTSLTTHDDIYVDPVDSMPLVPVAKWMIRKRTVPNGGRLRRLHGLARYDPNPLMSLLFSSKRPKEISPSVTNKPNAPPNAALKSSPIWSPDEDEMLVQAVRVFLQNWDLIADYVNSSHYLPGHTRSPYDCYTRYATLEKTGALNVYASKDISIKNKKDVLQKQKNFKVETRKKLAQHVALFDVIHKCVKARSLRSSLAKRSVPNTHSQPHASHIEAAEKVGCSLVWKNANPIDVLAKRSMRMKLLLNRTVDGKVDKKLNIPLGQIQKIGEAMKDLSKSPVPDQRKSLGKGDSDTVNIA